MPSRLWYSEEPFIDAAVRQNRFENIVVSLMDGGFDMGPWAKKIYNNVKLNLDKARS